MDIILYLSDGHRNLGTAKDDKGYSYVNKKRKQSLQMEMKAMWIVKRTSLNSLTENITL